MLLGSPKSRKTPACVCLFSGAGFVGSVSFTSKRVQDSGSRENRGLEPPQVGIGLSHNRNPAR